MPPPPVTGAPPPPLPLLTAIYRIEFFKHCAPPTWASRAFPLFGTSRKISRDSIFASRVPLRFPSAFTSRNSYYGGGGSDAYDPELRSVLELATDSELYELERILFGTSYFSPLLKSIGQRASVDHIMIGEDPDEREVFISSLESRGWRPSYRNVLLGIRKMLSIPCSAKLSSEGLEVEIFLHLTHEYSSEESGYFGGSNNLELGLSQWKLQKLAALGIGAAELRSVMLKSGGMLAIKQLLELYGDRLSGKMVSELAKYHIKKEVLKKGGQLAAINLDSAAAFLAAKQGLKTAALRYLGLRSVAQLLGPLMWGNLLADLVIQMLGTDHARILRAIYALAQIRIYRSHDVSDTT